MGNLTSEVSRGVSRWVIKSLIALAVFGVALFGSSGDLRWGMGWVYIGMYVVNQILLARILPPELLAERSKPKEGSKGWDVALAAVVALAVPLAIYVVAGFDRAAGWSFGLSPVVQVIALGVMVAGIALTDWAMAANAFFSGVIRIQEDRVHTVATGGPYRWVRHPGYVGAIAHAVAAPLMLGSWWALIPGGIGALLFVIRTALEDRVLQRELPGYADYAQRVRFRLAPGVW